MSRALINFGKTLIKLQTCRCKIKINESSPGLKTIFHCSKSLMNEENVEKNKVDSGENDEHNLPSDMAGKYKVFRDEDSSIIFDVNEEKKRIDLNQLNIEEEDIDPYEGINLNRDYFINFFTNYITI